MGDEWLPMLSSVASLAQRRRLFHDASSVLNDRERRVFEARLGDIPISREALSNEFGVSRERIRQIEAKALWKMRRWQLQWGKYANA